MPTLAEAKAHLRVEHGDEDVLIQLYLNAAQDRVETYIEILFADMDAVPPALEAAVLLILGHLYMNREEVVVGATVMTLPMSVETLCHPHRLQLV